MRNPQWAADLRTFPRDGHARFVDAVANGKRNMPAWDDVLNPEQMEALWAYVTVNTIGMVRVRRRNGPTTDPLEARMTSGASPTNPVSPA